MSLCCTYSAQYLRENKQPDRYAGRFGEVVDESPDKNSYLIKWADKKTIDSIHKDYITVVWIDEPKPPEKPYEFTYYPDDMEERLYRKTVRMQPAINENLKRVQYSGSKFV